MSEPNEPSMVLPPMPESGYDVWDDYYDGITLGANGPHERYHGLKLWNAEQMTAYGEACYRAGMERGASVAAGLDCAHRCCVGSEVAAAIRAKAKPLEIPTDPQPIEQVPFRTPKGR